MCAIVDANVAGEVFGPTPQPAGERFFDWVNKGSGRLVAGGKLYDELESSSPGFRDWAREAVLAGKMRIVNEGKVNSRTEQLSRVLKKGVFGSGRVTDEVSDGRGDR